MKEPTPDQLRAIENEFASAFPTSSADEMSPRAFDRLLDDLGYRGTPEDPTVNDLSLLSDRAPDAWPIQTETCEEYGTERYSVSLDSYDALHQDYQMALARRNRAESQVTKLRGKLSTAHWLLCIAYVLIAVMFAARIGGM